MKKDTRLNTTITASVDSYRPCDVSLCWLLKQFSFKIKLKVILVCHLNVQDDDFRICLSKQFTSWENNEMVL